MNFFSTFTGIGGFDLGLEQAGWRCVGQCEIEEYCLAVLKKRWPRVWRHPNVRTLTGQLIYDNCGLLDALVGGPPCQPSSVAGERRGADDDRWMWPDFLRVVSEINDAQERPLLWVLAENPRGVTSIRVEGLQFGEWLAREFEARGYELLPIELAAEDVGAPHRRERIWFVAHFVGKRRSRQDAQARQFEPAGDSDMAHADRPGRRKPTERRNEPDRTDARWEEAAGRPALRGEELADASGESQPGLPSRATAQITNAGVGRQDGELADAEHDRREGRIAERRGTATTHLRREGVANPDSAWQLEPQRGDEEEWRRTEDGGREQLAHADLARPQEPARRPGDARQELPPPLRTGWPARPGEDQAEWEEPRVLLDRRSYFKVSLLDADTGSRRGLTGVAGQMRRAFKPALGLPTDGTARRLAGRRRVAALKALGNAVVPQCAQILGEMINRFEEEQCFE